MKEELVEEQAGREQGSQSCSSQDQGLTSKVTKMNINAKELPQTWWSRVRVKVIRTQGRREDQLVRRNLAGFREADDSLLNRKS